MLPQRTAFVGNLARTFGGLFESQSLKDLIMGLYSVLIVDDQRDARSVLRAGLETLQSKLKIIDVPSGEEAMLVIASQPIDLLVADIRLPGMTGLELHERARQRNPDLKVILITGITDTRIRDKVVRAGAEAFFYKPVEMPDFLSAVERCLGLETEINGTPVIGVTERLGILRQTTQAICIVLISDNGNIVAQAGNLPPDIDETNLVHALLVTMDVTSKFSLAVGAAQPQDYMFFSGGAYDLALAHVSQTMGLLLIAPSRWEMMDQAKNLKSEIQAVVQDLLVSLSDIGVQVSLPESELAPAEPVEIEEEMGEVVPLPELDALFQKAEGIEKLTADAFWDAASGEDHKAPAGADTITYEQAQQLGLAPDEEQK
jgi:CheY-like chemotaxis protein